LLLALILLLHRLFWPAVQRPLYAVYRYAPLNAPLKEKKWMLTIGVALLFLPYHVTIDVLKAIIDKL
jgi:hypothetical protein